MVFLSNGESEEEEEHLEELEYLKNAFRGLKPYDFELERTSTSDPSNSHVASSSSTENIEQRNTVARRNTLDLVQVAVCRNESREVDCLCCEEMLAISEEKFEGDLFFVLFLRSRPTYTPMRSYIF